MKMNLEEKILKAGHPLTTPRGGVKKKDVSWADLRIAFITNMCPHYVVQLFDNLARDYHVDYYFTGGQEHYWNKKNPLRSGKMNSRYLKGISILPKLRITPGLGSLFSGRYDIFIKTIDDRFALPFVFLSAKLLRKPFILWTGLWFHPQTWIHKITFAFTRFIYRHCDALVVYGDHVKKYLVHLRIPAQKIFCAPHATDNTIFDKYVSPKEKLKLKAALGLSSEDKIVLYVGRFEECKGLDYLIEAVSEIKGFRATILFIGNGSQHEFLIRKSKQYSVQSRFLEHTDNQELYRYYAIADVFILPSVTTRDFKEPWGIVVNEAMNQGCPIIATDAVGAAMGGLVEDGKNGWIVPEKNSAQLRKAMEALFNDEALRRRMADAAYEKVKSWNHERMSMGFKQALQYVLTK